ncbi:MAG TPA: tetratricopeptide repeat protein [Rickettsia endosymbiont of Pyrocoelia pectoralis]|nr:tetratricopeptide repeat protein [Rickettsia endosymbiont of Pyrocoelia pectoralis]
MYILSEEKIEQRLLYIQTEFLNLTNEIPKNLRPISPFIQQVNTLQSSTHIPTVVVPIYKFKEIISLFDKKLLLAFWRTETPEIDILMKLFYEGNRELIILNDNTTNYAPDNFEFPAVQAIMDDVNLQVNNSFFIYITPKKRIKPIEMVLYQGLLYSKSEEIKPIISKDENKCNLFKEFVKKVINLYQEKDSNYVPFFNQYFLTFETYAENLSFDLAEKIFSSSFEEKLKAFIQKDLYSRFEELQKTLEEQRGITSCTTAEEWVDAATALPAGENEKALEYYNKALELEPNNEKALMYKALMLNYILKEPQRALECYDKLLKNGHTYYYDDANTYLNLNQYKEAIHYYKKVFSNDEIYIKTLYLLGFTYFKLEEYKNSIKYFDESIKLSEEAKNPKPKGFSDPITYLIYFNELIEDNKEKYLKVLDKILKTNPKSKSTLIFKVRILHDLQKYEEALVYCNKLYTLNPNCALSNYIKALTLMSLSKFEEAINYFEKGMTLGGSYEAWGTAKAFCLNKIGKYKEALTECDIVLAEDSKYVEALVNKANALRGLENYDEAFKLIDEAVAIDPNNQDAFAYKGFAKVALGYYKEAITAFDKTIALGVKDSQCTKDVIEARNEAFNKLRETSVEDDLSYLIEHTALSPQARINATQHFNSFKTLDGSEKSEYVKYIRDIIKLPWGKYDNTNIDLNKVEKILEKEHYGLEEVKTRILDSLVFMAASPKAKPLILCLLGPPGVGKTSIANVIAKALDRKCVTISLAGANDANLIRGCMSFYRSATPSKVLSLISDVGTCNPVMVLDEIDKIDLTTGKNIEDALLQLIDPSQNSNFTDEYFDFAFDLSKVFFVITANSLDRISEPLRNRMEIIEIKGYTENEKLEISKRYILPKILDEANLTIADFNISKDILEYIIKNYTNEPGVREIERLLRKLVQKYLRAKLKKKKPLINLELIETYLSGSSYNKTKFGF